MIHQLQVLYNFPDNGLKTGSKDLSLYLYFDDTDTGSSKTHCNVLKNLHPDNKVACEMKAIVNRTICFPELFFD